jgi:hypothetical protein
MECSAHEKTAEYSKEDGGKRVIIPRHIDDRTTTHVKRCYDAVSQYSGLDLTFDRDVLPAIEGMSGTFMEATGLQYAAAHWQEQIDTRIKPQALYFQVVALLPILRSLNLIQLNLLAMNAPTIILPAKSRSWLSDEFRSSIKNIQSHCN